MRVLYYQYPLPHIKIAFLSDIHNHDCYDCVDFIRQEHVDYICITGDILERVDHGKDPRIVSMNFKRRITHILHSILRCFFRKKADNDQNAFALLKELSFIAPVIISRGNHEWYYKESDLSFFKENNIILLDNEYVKIGNIVFGGLSSAYDLSLLEKMREEDGYKILLCHHPEYYPMIKEESLDLILSGHAHGGQIRIFNHGLYAPGQGFFPRYTLGIYHNMIVSSGLSNTFIIPRINNEESLLILRGQED